MLGAIAGDIIGSIYEGSRHRIQTKDFPLFNAHCWFTDDSVLTVAVADALLHETEYLDRHEQYIDAYHDYFARYPDAGFGGAFYHWANARHRRPYGSWGNGSAMRVSPIGYAFATLGETLAEAKLSAEVTHDHPEGVKGAQSVAAAIFLARTGGDKAAIKTYIAQAFGYDLDRRLDDIRLTYVFDVSCQGSVPESIIAFLESEDFEDAIRNAISLGGDSDTMACITGGIAEAFYGGVPEKIAKRALAILDDPLRAVVMDFQERFPS